MGSWSPTIMGGDGPLDAEGDILDFIGFENPDHDRYYEDHLSEVKDMFEKVPADSWEAFFAKGGSESYTADKQRVAALMIMACGAALPENVSKAALDACHEDTEDWSNPDDRERHLKEFADTIKAYDGTPTTVPSEGLFDVLADHMSGGSKPPAP